MEMGKGKVDYEGVFRYFHVYAAVLALPVIFE